MITFLISLAYFTAVSSGSMDEVFGGSSSKKSSDDAAGSSTGRFLEDKDEDKDAMSPFMKFIQVYNFFCMMYSGIFFLMLACFGA